MSFHRFTNPNEISWIAFYPSEITSVESNEIVSYRPPAFVMTDLHMLDYQIISESEKADEIDLDVIGKCSDSRYTDILFSAKHSMSIDRIELQTKAGDSYHFEYKRAPIGMAKTQKELHLNLADGYCQIVGLALPSLELEKDRPMIVEPEDEQLEQSHLLKIEPDELYNPYSYIPIEPWKLQERELEEEEEEMEL